MVSRLSLIFWRWVVEIHDRLHTAQDAAFWKNYELEAEREAALIDKYPTGGFTMYIDGSDMSDTVTYESDD